MNIHEKYISRCIELGKLGIGNTYPNPSVGCCIVLDDKIIGEGYTSKAGGNHAEVNAINSVEDKSLLKLSTIYVTLEPCCHHGKTPPCVDKIIASGMKKVVIGIKDPNPLVCGKGIEKLKENGIEVISGVLNKHLRIDSPYNTYKYYGLPPGIISMPSIQAIDAVLNYEKHNYYFFAADPSNPGYHSFAKSLSEHKRNARKFHRYLNSKGIKK